MTAKTRLIEWVPKQWWLIESRPTGFTPITGPMGYAAAKAHGDEHGIRLERYGSWSTVGLEPEGGAQ